MKFKLTQLKIRFKLWLIDILGLHKLLQNRFAEFKDTIDLLNAKLERKQAEYGALRDMYTYLEQKSLARTTESMTLNLQRVKGEGPVMIVTVPEKSDELTSDTFARMRHHLNSVCPDLKMILVVRGDLKFEELTDSQLEEHGLRRI
jgi:hypothetical protein